MRKKKKEKREKSFNSIPEFNTASYAGKGCHLCFELEREVLGILEIPSEQLWKQQQTSPLNSLFKKQLLQSFALVVSVFYVTSSVTSALLTKNRYITEMMRR